MGAYRFLVVAYVVAALLLSILSGLELCSYLGVGPWAQVSLSQVIQGSGSPGFSAPA